MMSLLDNVINLATSKQANLFLSTLNENQLHHLDGEIYGHKYWFNKGASFITTTEEAIAILDGVSVEIKSIIDSGNYIREKNENGLILERSHSALDCHQYASVYLKDYDSLLFVDFCFEYFINRKTRQITYYCESDVVTLTANSDEQLDLEVESIQKWYRDNY
jgi:hypothetical protein